MLPRVTFGFHSRGNVVSADFLKRSCCVPCLCVVQTLAPFRSAFVSPEASVEGSTLERAQSKDFCFTPEAAPGVTQTSQVGFNALMAESRRGSGSADVVPVCLCLCVFLHFCRISGQLNCGAANGYF